jgi:hypothetical protein
MPLCTLYLAQLDRAKSDVNSFVLLLLTSPVGRDLVTASRFRFPVIRSTSVDADVLNKPWDIIFLFVGSPEIPVDLRKSLVEEYKLYAGVHVFNILMCFQCMGAERRKASDPFTAHPKLQAAQLRA